MKKLLLPTITLLLTALFISVIPTEAEGAIYDDTIRLHILANSDSEEDQNLKLRLRDEILAEFGESLGIYEKIDEAKKNLEEKLGEISNFADTKLSDWGYEYKTEVSISEEWYDTRDYENFSLPCGYYTSLRIIIGKGEGENWWCVMFPPLCLDAATSKKKYTDAEDVLISKKYNVKFKLLELISEIGR